MYSLNDDNASHKSNHAHSSDNISSVVNNNNVVLAVAASASANTVDAAVVNTTLDKGDKGMDEKDDTFAKDENITSTSL